MKKHIPNFITCMNLLCGCVGIVLSFKGNLVWAAYLVGIASVFDFMDGMTARLLKVYSPIGKELDSLADMVTFGVLPGVMLFVLLQQSNLHNYLGNELLERFVKYVPFCITIFSALRLAKFNVDTRQTSSFIGLPTPANTIFIASLPLILANDKFGLSNIILHPYFLIALTIMMSYLLVAEIPLFSLKFKNLQWKSNRIQYVFLGTLLILLLTFFFAAIPMIIFLYIALSLLNNLKTKTP